MVVKDEKELGKALKNEEEEIELRGELAKKMKKIYQLDQTLWCLCLVCLAVTVTALLAAPATAGTSTVVSLTAGTPAAAIIGIPSAVSAVLTAAAGGGIHILSRMRRRMMKQLDNGHIILYLSNSNFALE